MDCDKYEYDNQYRFEVLEITEEKAEFKVTYPDSTSTTEVFNLRNRRGDTLDIDAGLIFDLWLDRIRLSLED
jgi:hypothetical protein